jgi:hypothetical protein
LGDLILAFVFVHGGYAWILGSASYFVFGANYTAFQFCLVLAFMKQVRAEGPADYRGLILNEPVGVTPYENFGEKLKN